MTGPTRTPRTADDDVIVAGSRDARRWFLLRRVVEISAHEQLESSASDRRNKTNMQYDVNVSTYRRLHHQLPTDAL